MNPDEQRIAIAEACGWKPKIIWCSAQIPESHPPIYSDLPDYLNDLNAAHEALRLLHKDEILWAKYREYMHRFYLANDTFPPSAEQICEGILNALHQQPAPKEQ